MIPKTLHILLAGTLMIAISSAPLTAATLSWKASSGEVDGYKIYYGTSSSPTTKVTVGNVTSYSIDKLPLTENKKYFFCVSAFNDVGESKQSATVAYTPADSTPPFPPVGLKEN